jgi:hypothetical protein
MKFVVMLETEWSCDPNEMIAPTNVVLLHMVRASAEHTVRRIWTQSAHSAPPLNAL